MDLAALVPAGSTASRSLVVTPEVTVARWAEGTPPVFGTPFLVRLMEVAASAVLGRWKSEAEAAGGTRPGTLPGGAA